MNRYSSFFLAAVLAASVSSCRLSDEQKAQKTIENFLKSNKVELFDSPSSLKILKYGSLVEVLDSLPSNQAYLDCDSIVNVYYAMASDAQQSNKTQLMKSFMDSVAKYEAKLQTIEPVIEEVSLGYAMDVYFTTTNSYNAEVKSVWTFVFVEPDILWSYTDDQGEKTRLYDPSKN